MNKSQPLREGKSSKGGHHQFRPEGERPDVLFAGQGSYNLKIEENKKMENLIKTTEKVNAGRKLAHQNGCELETTEEVAAWLYDQYDFFYNEMKKLKDFLISEFDSDESWVDHAAMEAKSKLLTYKSNTNLLLKTIKKLRGENIVTDFDPNETTDISFKCRGIKVTWDSNCSNFVEIKEVYVQDIVDFVTNDLKVNLRFDSTTTIEKDGVNKLKEEIAQLRVQLAGCGVVANGGILEEQIAKKDSYGWSPAYQNVLDLRLKYDKLKMSISKGPQVHDVDKYYREE